MSGIDRIGSGKKPTGPLPTGNGATPPAGPGPAGSPQPAGEHAKDSVAATTKGAKSRIRASEEIPQANDACSLTAEVAAFKAKGPPAFATLLDGGAPYKFKKPGILKGDALNRLKAHVQIGDKSQIVSPADLGLIKIAHSA